MTKFPALKVHSSQRYLVTENGQPFFWLADTAWELFHRLSRSEADIYLRDRAAKKFTVIQAVVLAELDGRNSSAESEHFCYINNYFCHVYSAPKMDIMTDNCTS